MRFDRTDGDWAPGTARENTARGRDRDLQRARGAGRIVLDGSDKGNRIVDLVQRSPIRVMFPRIERGAIEEAVLVNTAGGVAGGDQLDLAVIALDGASLAVTSQAAEKVYRALDEPARITTTLKADKAARLAWLPQETIIFDRARINRVTEIDLASGAELLALEWFVLGRVARGEDMTEGHVTESWRVRRDGRLVWADSFRATNQTFPHLNKRALLSKFRAIGTLIYAGPDVDVWLDRLRSAAGPLTCSCAVTLVGGLVITRFAAAEIHDLKRAAAAILDQFGRGSRSGPFRVPKLWSC